jgi:ABC-type uncharacterized transport system permease subunit
MVASSNPAHIMEAGLYDGTTIFIFWATIAFAVLSCVNLGMIFLIWRNNLGRISARIYLTVVASALCIITVYMAYWDLIGFRAWAY